MRNIWTIYTTDLRKVCTNIPALILIIGLTFLPSVYSWVNIIASWDPYSNTQGIKVAVANEDVGSTIMNKPINIGKQIIESLQHNNKIGWTFVDSKQALKGVKHGDYYASIIIPRNFSASLGSVLSDNPEQAVIAYYVNEKTNAIAPKITSKGASGIVSEVSSNFVKTANGVIFNIFNEIGVELDKELPTIERAKKLLFTVERDFPMFEQILQRATHDLGTVQGLVHDAEASIPKIKDILQTGQQFSQGASEILDHSAQGIQSAAPFVKQDLITLQEASGAAEAIQTALLQKINSPSLAELAIERALPRFNHSITLATGAKDWFVRLNQLSHGLFFRNDIERLNRIIKTLEQQKAATLAIQSALQRGETVSEELVSRLQSLAQQVNNDLNSLINRFDSEIMPQILEVVNKAKATSNEVTQALGSASEKIPAAEKLLGQANQGLQTGANVLPEINRQVPAIKQKISEFANTIREFEKQGNISQVIDLLQNNAEKESAFFANPVQLKENSLYPIPNYGSGMSPFYTTLSLWVGALLLVSLMTVEVHHPNVTYAPYQIYFGRFLTFATIAILQSIVDTAGGLYILGIYAKEHLWVILFGMLLSFIFMLIVYTLVSVFGNVGKALGIILLVLQLAGSGGTFPVQMTPPFFQKIHPFLPFTYGISLMREATGGILWDIVQRDVLWLIGFTAIALVFGLLLKKPLNQASRSFVEKVKKSGLIH